MSTLNTVSIELIAIICGHLLGNDLGNLRLTCSNLKEQLDKLGVKNSIIEGRGHNFTFIYLIRSWKQLGIEQIEKLDYDGHIYIITTNHVHSYKIMSIVDSDSCRYMYINNGMAKYMLSFWRDSLDNGWILKANRPMKPLEFIDHWLRYKYNPTELNCGLSINGSIYDIVHILDIHWAGLKHIYAPEVIKILTDF